MRRAASLLLPQLPTAGPGAAGSARGEPRLRALMLPPPHHAAAQPPLTGVSLFWRRLLSGSPQDVEAVRHVKDMDTRLLTKARQLAVAVGVVAGVFGSLVGVGGGVIIAPVILNACPNIPQRVISGTSLAAVAATGTMAGLVYWRSGHVDPGSAVLLAAGSVLTAPLGARATHFFDCKALRMAMGYWLYLVAPLIPAKALIFARMTADADSGSSVPGDTDASGGDPAESAAPSAAMAEPPPPSSSAPSAAGGSGPIVVAIGIIAGFASGLLGIGGGTVVTPLLALTTGLSQTTVLGTSLAAMVAPSMVGLAQHARLGNVDWVMGAGLAAGTLFGSAIGSSLAVQAPPGVLEALFAVGMVFLGRKTLVAAHRAAAMAVSK